MDIVKLLAACVNRSLRQEEFLFELCNNEFDKLLKLEASIKQNHVMCCPNDKETVNELLLKYKP